MQVTRDGTQGDCDHLIVYNCIRALISEAVRGGGKVRRISFKGALQAVQKWEPCLKRAALTVREITRMIRILYQAIASNIVRSDPEGASPEQSNEDRKTTNA